MQNLTLPIQLNPYQLSLLTQVESNLKNKSKPHYLKLSVCIFLSLSVHSLIFYGPVEFFNTNTKIAPKLNKILNLSLQQSQKSEPLVTPIVKKSSDAKDDSIQQIPELVAAENAEQLIPKQPIPQLDPQKSIAQIQPEVNQPNKISIQSLRESLSKNEIINELEQQSVDPNFVVFDPRLRNDLKAIEDQRKETSLIEAEQQFRKDNEFYEYQEVGGQRIVRVDGNCFIVPTKDPFAVVQSIWTILGPCENEKKLLIKPGLFSHQYKAENDDRYQTKK